MPKGNAARPTQPKQASNGHAPSANDLYAMITVWSRVWNVPRLGERVRIEFSRRFTSSIGRYDLRSKTIRLAHWLLEHDSRLLREVLCHEAAHAAAYEAHGRRCRPHGDEWKRLMRAAGFEPRVRLPERELPVTRTGRKRRRRVHAAWIHRCPVCNEARATTRRMPDWRCMRCWKAGRSGKLVISHVPAPT